MPTTLELRSTYHALRATHVLYGSGNRWHLAGSFEETLADDDGTTIRATALERLDYHSDDDRRGTSFGIIHVEGEGPDPAAALSRLLQPPTGVESVSQLGVRCRELFGTDAMDRGRRWGSSLLLVPEEPPAEQAGTSGWTGLDQALWSAANLAPITEVPPDLEDPTIRAGRIFLSATWRALAVRDGVGFVWRVERDHPFLKAAAPILVRTVYTDCLVLAAVQRAELEAIADSLAAIDYRAKRMTELRPLEDRATILRNRLWWDDVATSGLGNSILRAAQSALRTPQLFDRVMEDLGEFRSVVETAELRRATQIQEDMERSREQFELVAKRAGAAFAAVTLVLAILGLNIEGWTATGVSWGTVVLSVLVAGVGGVGLYEIVRRSSGSGTSKP